MRYLNQLAENRLFVGLTPEQRQRALALFDRRVVYEPHELVVHEGEVDRTLFLIEVGDVAVRLGGRHLATLPAGDVFGEVGFVSGGSRTASVFAGPSGCTLRLVAHTRFRQLGIHQPAAAWAMSESITFLLSGKLRRANLALREAFGRLDELRRCSRDQC